MNELNPVLSLYLTLNVVLLAVWVLRRFVSAVTKRLHWNLPHSFQLQSARQVFCFALLGPLFFIAMGNLLPQAVSDDIQKPAQVVYVALNNLISSPSEIKPHTETSLYQFNVWDVAIILLALLLAFLVVRTVYRVLRLFQIVRHSYRYKTIGTLRILIANDIAVPFSTKLFFKNQIVVPQTLVDSRKYFSAIIAHEGQHLRNGDTLWELLLEILTLAFFWNPAIYLWKAEFSQLQEFACDEAVIQKKTVSRYDYGNCLLHVVELAKQNHFKPIASSCMAGSSRLIPTSKTQLERRLKMLVERSENYSSSLVRRFYGLGCVASALLISTVIAACTGANSTKAANESGVTEEREIQYSVQIVEFTPNDDIKNDLDWDNLEELLTFPQGEGQSGFSKYVNALNQIGKAEVMSMPVVKTEDSKPIYIKTSTEVPWPSNHPGGVRIYSEKMIHRFAKRSADSQQKERVISSKRITIDPGVEFNSSAAKPEDKMNIVGSLEILPDVTATGGVNQTLNLDISGIINFDDGSQIELIFEADKKTSGNFGEVSLIAEEVGGIVGGETATSNRKAWVFLIRPILVDKTLLRDGMVILDVNIGSFEKVTKSDDDYTENFGRIETKLLLKSGESFSIPNSMQPSVDEDSPATGNQSWYIEIEPVISEDKQKVNLLAKLFEKNDSEFTLVDQRSVVSRNGVESKMEFTSASGATYEVVITLTLN